MKITMIKEISAREGRQKGASSNSSAVSDCSRDDVLAKKIEVCAKPLMDILEGTLEKWPQVDADIENLCGQFYGSERCIRANGRKCAKGLQKVITSTVANSIQRARKRECLKTNFPAFLKLTKCIENNRPIIHQVITNATSQLAMVESMKNLDRRTTAICCTLNNIELELLRLFKPICLSEVAIFIRLYRAVIQDVLEIICQHPNCKNPFEGYQLPNIDLNSKSNTDGGIVAFILRITFSLGNKVD